jgi:threonine dehydrogenase-like Zn-dependent dehydrogenase
MQETAISLVMSAQPVLGETVGVIGQGLIGQLISTVLLHMGFKTCAVDVRNERLHAIYKYAAMINQESLLTSWNPQSCTDVVKMIKSDQSTHEDTSAVHESSSQPHPEFDCCIEVSGNLHGLQSAIDLTGDYGKVIIGSLYGDKLDKQGKNAILKLGTKFHRSHLHMVSSQVSNIPAILRGRWSKARRFDLTWDMIRKIQPSKLIMIDQSIKRQFSPDKPYDENHETLHGYKIPLTSSTLLQQSYMDLLNGDKITILLTK